MKFKKTKIAAFALAGMLACGSLAGCTFVTTDSTRDLLQVVADVDISKSELISTGYSDYADIIQKSKSEILKRELIAGYASIGATYVNYGMSQEAAYTTVLNSLVNRQIYVQYALAYFLKNGYTEKDESGHETKVTYYKDKYLEAINNADEKDKDIAGIQYFLNDKEEAIAEYNLKVSINAALDAQEEEVIEGNHTHDHDHNTSTSTSSSRTTPTGVNATNEDFYDPAYKIYTGSNSASDCGTYETIDESTPAKRKQAYKNFLASLSVYGLIDTSKDGENTSDITSLSYYALERKSQYETALINKLNDAFEAEAESKITEDWITKEKFKNTLNAQMSTFSSADNSALQSALDGASDTSFVFYAPDAYGYVINILLPFSTAQTQELNDAHADYGDKKGNTFQARAEILKKVTATDLRSAWFSADYAYETESGDEAFGGKVGSWLFFENNMKKSTPANGSTEAQYEALKNYYGKYPYNGEVNVKEDDDGDKTYSFKPEKLGIDDFLLEMEKYLNFAGLNLTVDSEWDRRDDYYDQKNYYDENGDVDYSKFVYYAAKINELEKFDANRMFVKDTNENNALSVINELSFAYNTDTGGFNSYLGYTVVPTKTNFVSEFEFASQLAVKMGPGSITVAPSQYGWHIMYCTMAYSEKNPTPYTFDWNQRFDKGTFSNLYYEALKADNFESFSSDNERNILNDLNNEDCVTIYTERYKDRYSA